MTRKPDWGALGKLFAAPPVAAPDGLPSASEDCATYLGELIPKWLARDLMQERAAIYEYEAGLSRDKAEALAKAGLRK